MISLATKLEASVECGRSGRTICGLAASFNSPSPTYSKELDRLIKNTGRDNDHGQHAYADEKKVSSIHTVSKPSRSRHYQGKRAFAGPKATPCHVAKE